MLFSLPLCWGGAAQSNSASYPFFRMLSHACSPPPCVAALPRNGGMLSTSTFCCSLCSSSGSSITASVPCSSARSPVSIHRHSDPYSCPWTQSPPLPRHQSHVQSYIVAMVSSRQSVTSSQPWSMKLMQWRTLKCFFLHSKTQDVSSGTLKHLVKSAFVCSFWSLLTLGSMGCKTSVLFEGRTWLLWIHTEHSYHILRLDGVLRHCP